MIFVLDRISLRLVLDIQKKSGPGNWMPPIWSEKKQKMKKIEQWNETVNLKSSKHKN
jgi:hypothetical protein